MNAPNTKKVYIVLLRSNTLLSNLIHLVTGDEYTHAAISLDQNLEYMFSFGRRRPRNPFTGGFRRECLDEGLYAMHQTLPGAVLELEITDAQQQALKNILEEFILNSFRYGYNYFGLLGNLVHSGMESNNRFLCSQFVYQILYQCGICNLELEPALVRPQNFLNLNARIVYQGDLKQLHRSQQAASSPLSLLSRAG